MIFDSNSNCFYRRQCEDDQMLAADYMEINLYHSLGKFSRQFDDFFFPPNFPQKMF